MTFYDPQSWQVPIREATWEQQPHPGSRQEANSTMQHQYLGAFHAQLEEVDRALDNLAKSGKLPNAPTRRDSMPMMGGPPSYSDYPPRMPQRHSISDYEQIRPHSGGNLQSYYATQRHQPRPNEAEQMMQAKRRMAAQRERELRNYHQEQQYNRNVNTQGKSDRAISPNTMNEEDRRELIARQHRALYGEGASPYFDGTGNYGDESHTPRPSNNASGNTTSAGGRGPSPRTYESYGKGQGHGQGGGEEAGAQLNANDQNQQINKGPSPKPQQQRSRADSTSSPASNPPSQNFSLFDAAQQSSRTSTSSPGGSPPRQTKTSAPGPAPIGTRPLPQATNPVLLNNNKRSGTPSQSPLSYGFAHNNINNNESLNANNPNGNNSTTERSTSSASNPKDPGVGSWGAGGGVWGSNSANGGNNKSLGVQASVWG